VKVLEKGQVDKDVELQPDDIISVPQRLSEFLITADERTYAHPPHMVPANTSQAASIPSWWLNLKIGLFRLWNRPEAALVGPASDR
jgi:hypothetical protein